MASTSGEFYALSLHDALPISAMNVGRWAYGVGAVCILVSCAAPKIRLGDPQAEIAAMLARSAADWNAGDLARSEEHTSELQSLRHLVCRLLPEKKRQDERFDI